MYGSVGQSASPLIDKLLAERPAGAESSRDSAGPKGRRPTLLARLLAPTCLTELHQLLYLPGG
jgi:hypothetical protein